MGPWGIKNYYGLEISEVDPLETDFGIVGVMILRLIIIKICGNHDLVTPSSGGDAL